MNRSKSSVQERKACLSLIILFFAGLAAVSYTGVGIIIAYLLFWLAVLGISALYYRLLPDTLPCRLELPGTLRKGEKAAVRLHVVQRGRIPIFRGEAHILIKGLYYQQEERISLPILLMGGEEGIAIFDITFPYLGITEILLEEAEIYGLLGIGRKTILSNLKKQVTVMPDIRKVAVDFPVLSDPDPEGDKIRESSRGYDPGLYQGIRPYREGDSLRNIHWKLTGKTGEIMVRELGIPVGREPRLHLDTDLPDLDPARIDSLMEDYLSCSMTLLEQGKPHILCWFNNGEVPEEHRVENFTRLEELLEPIFHITFREENSREKDTWIYYMSHERNIVYGLYHGEEEYLLPVY